MLMKYTQGVNLETFDEQIFLYESISCADSKESISSTAYVCVFVQNFGAKNHKDKHNLIKASKFAFVGKMLT